MKFEFSFVARCELVLSHTKGSKSSSVEEVNFNLDVYGNLDRDAYLQKDGTPTKVGAESLTNVFIQGLVGNIHRSHQLGHRDSAEHLRYIISELERGFVQQAETGISTFKHSDGKDEDL